MVKRKIPFLLAVLLMSPFFIVYAGDTGKIAGTITDATSGNPLVGANIILKSVWINSEEQNVNFSQGAASDINGYYFILNVAPGTYSVQCNFIGYGTEIQTQVVVDVDKTTTVDFGLLSKTIEGETVTVIAHKNVAVQRDLTATKQVYTVENIQSIAGVSDIGDIISMQADVVDDHFRGGREGESKYLLGGGTIVNPLDNRRAFKPIVTGLQQVEVYTSGFSAEYGNAQSGVVNMVTKEGASKWESRLELSATMPYYKTWLESVDENGKKTYAGGSPYSTESLDFYSTLRDEEEWLTGFNPVYQLDLWDLGYSFAGYYLPARVEWPPNPLNHGDSLQLAKMGVANMMLALRQVGLEYNNTFDYNIDFSSGGPIDENLRLFIAGRQNTEYCIIPTTNPDINRQLMGSLVYQKSSRNKLKFNYLVDKTTETYFNSAWQYWLIDGNLATSQISTLSSQYGIEWKHVVNNATYFDIKANCLDLLREEKINLLDVGEFIADYRNNSNWLDYTTPSNLRVGRGNDDSGAEESMTWNIATYLSSQVNNYNLIKAGMQFFYYDLEIENYVNRYSTADIRIIDFEGNPYEGAFYIQDKMEFEGLIAHIGLRSDFYQLNTKYYADLYSPIRNPYYNADAPTYLERGDYYSDSLAVKKFTDLYVNLQPRIGISFPVSEYTVFHLNYGTFTQRPTFEQLFYNEVRLSGENFQINILGNPRLKPEVTQSYDIGIVKGFGKTGITLDISAYYKDVRNLVETAYYYDEQQALYSTYINRDYADIKGFHINLERNSGIVRGYIRYNYESATGRSSNALNAPVTYFEKLDEVFGTAELPDPEDIYLDYDRTNKFVFNLRFQTPTKYGPKILNHYPCSNISLSSSLRYMTGRPYTDPSQGIKYGERTPDERDLKLRMEKTIRTKKQRITIYGEVFNLLNEPVYYYSRTFSSDYNTPRWIYDNEDILTYELYSPYVTSQDIYLLSNEPRHWRFGIVFKF